MNFENDIINCLEVLKKGGTILYPTDTVWGIGCDATNEVAVEKLYRLKRRSDEKAMIVLVAEERDVLKHVAAPDLSVFDRLQEFDRPTTVIYDHALGFAANLPGEDGSIAIRITADPFCRQLIRRFRKPIVSTSANISGHPAPKNFMEIREEILKAVDYVVEYRQGDTSVAAPSMIVRWKDGMMQVLRP